MVQETPTHTIAQTPKFTLEYHSRSVGSSVVHSSFSDSAQATSGLSPLPSDVVPLNPKYSSRSRPFKILTGREIDEMGAKGLCFWCDKMFRPGH